MEGGREGGGREGGREERGERGEGWREGGGGEGGREGGREGEEGEERIRETDTITRGASEVGAPGMDVDSLEAVECVDGWLE